MLVLDEKPDFISPQGIKWWLDKMATQYAQEEDIHGTKLPSVRVFLVEEMNGRRVYLILDGNEIIYESQTLEGIGTHIDIKKFAERSKIA